jgi:ribA/ribD-fused uncharacterized protein
VLPLALDQFRLDVKTTDHGPRHWGHVWLNAKLLCKAHSVPPEVPCWFAYLHDACRVDEGRDHEHGPRAAAWAIKLRCQGELALSDENFEALHLALHEHSNGHSRGPLLAKICWDADRLDLGRVGIAVNPEMLCTPAARRLLHDRRAELIPPGKNGKKVDHVNKIDAFRWEHAFLSNFSPARIELDGQLYPSVEHAYQAAKTWRPSERLQFTRGSAGDAKKKGRTVHVRDDWDEVKIGVMRSLLAQKFEFGTALGVKLLETGRAVLIEGNSWGDTFWGVSLGVGHNHLGRLLMEQRDRLRKENGHG